MVTQCDGALLPGGLGALWAGPELAAVGGATILAALWMGHARAPSRFARSRDTTSSQQDRPPARIKPPVVLLGGEANALSVARDLGRMGVEVYVLSDPESIVPYSRYCRRIDVPSSGDVEQDWATFLLGPGATSLHGAVVLTCSDAGIRVLIRHRDALARLYRLDQSNPAAASAMLDKLTTYRHAVAAGVITPRFWEVETRDDLFRLADQLVFPLLVKPRLSHLFEAHFGRKHLTAHTFDDVLRAFDAAAGAEMEMLLVELIPGGDDRICSYFTYLDERGTPILHFTKRVIRRYPAGMGGATYHITDWNPDLIAPSNRLFDEVGLRGMANIEFKQDPRDGQYKLIECNARFVASNALVSASGVPLAALVYNRITNQPMPELRTYTRGLRQLDPVRDFAAFRELRRDKRITLTGWLKSVLHRQRFPFFSWTDPLPALMRMTKPIRRRVGKFFSTKEATRQ